jgi:hypothetical protein
VRHPAEFFIKYLCIRYPQWTDAQIQKKIADWGFLSVDDHYLPFMKQSLPDLPPDFDPSNVMHRPSQMYLRTEGVYDMFRNTPVMQEAWDILSRPDQRLIAEQIIISRLDLKIAAQRVNKKHGWFLTAEGLSTFRHYFWNPKLLTFDEWGRFLYGRSALYERHMALLQGDQRIALYHLRLEQAMESKVMIQRAQEIAYYTLEEVNQKPGTQADKVKAIAILTKAVVECHEALSTSDMALKDVLKQFERFRIEHPHQSPPDIHALAPAGNFSGSGQKERDDSKLPN